MRRISGLLACAAIALIAAEAKAQEAIVSRHVAGDIPLDPAAAVWEKGDGVTVLLDGQMVTPPMAMEASVGEISVRSLHNGREIAFRLTWQDPTEDRFHTVARFSDAVAVQVPYRPSDEVSVTMGGPEDRVLILHWTAFRQENVDNGYADLDKIHPNATWDWYPHAERPYHYPEDWRNQYALNYIGGEKVFRKNTLATPVREVVAEGFGSSTWKDVQGAEGRGVYRDGTWTVVIKRRFVEESSSNPDWGRGTDTFVTFAVWNGGNDERGARKALGYVWSPLSIE